MPGADHSGRETILSCGVVLDHLCVVMLGAGWLSRIKRFPNPHDPEHLASIEFSSSDRVTGAQRDHAEAILHRRTHRLPLGNPGYWGLFEHVLRSTFDDTLVMLDVLSDEVRPQLAKASQISEALRGQVGTIKPQWAMMSGSRFNAREGSGR